MNFKLYSSKYKEYALNCLHFIFEFKTCFDIQRKIFEIQRLIFEIQRLIFGNLTIMFKILIWNSNVDLRHSKIFFESQTLIFELQR